MELNCILWYCIVSYGNALVLHGISLYCMVLQDVALYGTVLHCIVLNLMVLHGIARCCIVLDGIALYRIKSYGIAWYCMVLHCTIVGFGARAVSRKTHIYFIANVHIF